MAAGKEWDESLSFLGAVSVFTGIMVSNSLLELRRTTKNPRMGKMLVIGAAMIEAWTVVWAPVQMALSGLRFEVPGTQDMIYPQMRHSHCALTLLAAFIFFSIGKPTSPNQR